MPIFLAAQRVNAAKRAFSTRRVPKADMCQLLTGEERPRPGDLVLARVDEIIKHTKLELTDGRRAHMFSGDEIVVAYGNRYAPDQYEALICEDLSPCDLVAAGGMAAMEVSRHQRMLPPTRISPLGLLARADGSRLNLADYRIEASENRPPIAAVLSLGTSMNAGKTLTATSLVRGFKRQKLKVAALKITGTGAGGDVWIVRDAGADVVADFTDAGFSSTYLTPIEEIEAGCLRLLNHAARQGCDIAVIEIADGLQQVETAQLIHSRKILDVTLGTVFAAYDAMGAKYGVDVLRAAGHNVMAMSGRIGRSPLGVREAEAATGLRVYSPWELQEGMLAPEIRKAAADAYIASDATAMHLRSLARPFLKATDGVVSAASNVVSLSPPPSTREEKSRAVLGKVIEALMSKEIDILCGAQAGTRNALRANRRNGFRRRMVPSCFGDLAVRAPRLRTGAYKPHPQLLGAKRETVFTVIDAAGTTSFDAALARLVESLRAEHVSAPDLFDLRVDVLSAIGVSGSRPDFSNMQISEPSGLADDVEFEDEIDLDGEGFDEVQDEYGRLRHAGNPDHFIRDVNRQRPSVEPLDYIPIPAK